MHHGEPGRWTRLAAAAETVFAVSGLLLLLSYHCQNSILGYPIWRLRALSLGTYLIAAGLLLVNGRHLRLVARLPFVWLLVALAFVSASWSQFPLRTLEQSGYLLGTTLFGWYLATRFDLVRLLRCVAFTLAVAMAAGVVLRIVATEQALVGSVWKGVFNHENILGAFMALGCLVFLQLVIGDRPGRRFWWLGLLASALFVYLSGSRTARVEALIILGLPLATAAGFRFKPLPRRFLQALGGLIAVAGSVVFVLVLTHTEALSGFFRRALFASGRSHLWSDLLPLVAERPLLGYGYEAFWLVDGPAVRLWSVTAEFARNTWSLDHSWWPRHAHNGYLNLMLELGVVGLSLFLVGFARALARTSRMEARGSGLFRQWGVMYLVVLTGLFNLVETSIPSPNNVFWCLYAATLVLTLRPEAVAAEFPLRRRASRLVPRIAGATLILLGLGLMADRAMDIRRETAAYRNHGLGVELMARGELAAASLRFKRASELRPGWHLPQINLGITYQHLDQHEPARRHFDRAVELDPDSGEALYYRGDYHLSLGRYDAAAEDLDQSMAMGREDYDIFMRRAVAAAGLGAAKDCLDYCFRCLVLDRQRFGQDIVRIAEPFFQEPSLAPAGVEVFEGLSVRLPDTWWVHHNLGTLASRAGRRRLAEEALARAEQLRQRATDVP